MGTTKREHNSVERIERPRFQFPVDALTMIIIVRIRLYYETIDMVKEILAFYISFRIALWNPHVCNCVLIDLERLIPSVSLYNLTIMQVQIKHSAWHLSFHYFEFIPYSRLLSYIDDWFDILVSSSNKEEKENQWTLLAKYSTITASLKMENVHKKQILLNLKRETNLYGTMMPT